VPIKNKEVTPFEEWEKKRLNLSYLRTWGCLAKVNVPINKKQKFGPKTVDCVFLSYAIHNMGYRFLIINSKVPHMVEGIIIESRDATFFENEFPMKNVPSTSSHDFASLVTHEPGNIVADESHENIPEEDNGIVTRKSKRRRVAKSFSKTISYTLWMTPPKP
jgi:hypothetical protein